MKDTRYDTLLDMYEPDLTVEKVDAVFARLKARLVPNGRRSEKYRRLARRSGVGAIQTPGA